MTDGSLFLGGRGCSKSKPHKAKAAEKKHGARRKKNPAWAFY